MLGKVFPLGVHVPRGGYAWSQQLRESDCDGPRPATCLFRIPATGDAAGFDTRHPDVEHRALFKDFTLIRDEDPLAILGFANHWGTLGGRGWGRESREDAFGETIDAWRYEIGRLRMAVRIHDLLHDGDQANELVGLVRYEQKAGPRLRPAWYVRNGHSSLVDAAAEIGKEYGRTVDREAMDRVVGWTRLDGEMPDDTPLPVVAWSWLNKTIEDTLSERGSVRLRFGEEKPGKHAFHIQPATLLGLMWCQFARAIILGVRTPQCQHCGKPFEVLTKTPSSRVFCGSVCKVRAFRQRKLG